MEHSKNRIELFCHKGSALPRRESEGSEHLLWIEGGILSYTDGFQYHNRTIFRTLSRNQRTQSMRSSPSLHHCRSMPTSSQSYRSSISPRLRPRKSHKVLRGTGEGKRAHKPRHHYTVHRSSSLSRSLSQHTSLIWMNCHRSRSGPVPSANMEGSFPHGRSDHTCEDTFWGTSFLCHKSGHRSEVGVHQ